MRMAAMTISGETTGRVEQSGVASVKKRLSTAHKRVTVL
jgi:hypothetical protein